jgi:hypothetical protein
MLVCNAVALFCWLQMRRKVIALSKIGLLEKYSLNLVKLNIMNVGSDLRKGE